MIKKIVLITGGTKGIGFYTAAEFGKNGYDVCICSRNSGNLSTAKEKLLSLGVQVKTFQCDISQEAEVKSMFKKMYTEVGAISVLVNNASITTYKNKIEDIGSENFLEIFKTNVYGAMLCVREASKHMKELGQGAIVNLSSEAATFGGVEMSLYASSKAAINTFTKSSARELAEFNIRVNAISPSVIDTDSHEDISNERRERLLSSIPLKRMGEPKEVAQIITWLASDQSSYITGAIIPVTGGR